MKGPSVGLARNTLKINIKVPKEFKQFKELHARLKDATVDMAYEAKSLWETEAGQLLGTTRDRYIRALEVTTDRSGSSVGLNPEDKLVQMLEKGSRAYDLKPGLLSPNSKGIKYNKDGVPFRHVTLDPVHRKGPYPVVTVSGNTPKEDWWHPGFEGIHIRPVVYRALKNEIVPDHVNRIIKELNFKV